MEDYYPNIKDFQQDDISAHTTKHMKEYFIMESITKMD